MNKRVERQINKIYEEVFNKIFTKARIAKLSKGNKTDIRKAVNRLQNSKEFKAFCKEFAKRLAKQGLNTQRGVWRKYFEAAKAAHYVAIPHNYKDFEIKVMQEAIKHNFKMIKSIPQEVLELTKFQYIDTMIEQVAKNTLPRGAFERQLKQHGAKRARLIARTETAKLQTAITQARSTELGSVAYIWVSSNDKRTRPSHKKMNGVVVFWRKDEQKPLLDNMRGNAGEFPNCRCDTEPIFDESDLTKNNYNVYDYRKDKVVGMTKKELVAALEKGEL